MALHEAGLGFLKSLSLPHGAQVYKVNLGRALPTHRGLLLEKGILTLIPRVIMVQINCFPIYLYHDKKQAYT